MEQNSAYKNREIPSMNAEALVEYIHTFRQIQQNNPNIVKIESIQNFRRNIKNSPSLTKHFQQAIDQIPQKVFIGTEMERKSILYKHTVDDILDLLNIIIQTPPRFWPSDQCGVPIYSLFVDLINTKFGPALFALPQVNTHLKNILDDYGSFLKSEHSLKHINNEEGGWASEEALKYINYDDFLCDKNKPYLGFKCWNDWFTRELAEGARPIDEKDDPLVIVHSSQNYLLTTVSMPATNIKATDQFWLKQHRYSLYDMFAVSEAEGIKTIVDQSFVGGTLYQGYLSPWCYHRWHSPVSGTVQRLYKLNGSYYQRNPNMDPKEPYNYKNSQPFLSCVSTRHIFIINTHNKLIGRVALIQIGMVEVSSLVLI